MNKSSSLQPPFRLAQSKILLSDVKNGTTLYCEAFCSTPKPSAMNELLQWRSETY
jgi:hypothetical protein